MSHYAIAVFSSLPTESEFNRLLERYDENNRDEFVFEPVSTQQLQEKWSKFRVSNPLWKKEDWLDRMFTKKGDVYGHEYNPLGYYDYYSLDGRSYMYNLKPDVCGEDADWYLKSQYDWDLENKGESESSLREKWREYSTVGDAFWNEKYYLERYGNEETFVRQMQYPQVPYAFVTPDGEWHAPGRVGWFAISDETAESYDAYVSEWIDFIKNGPDCYVSLVDCHI